MLHHSHSRYKKYYMTEDRRAMRDLMKIRNNTLTK
nr:MAG TPA: hypothetical protein [Caudoviricetes sp.]